MSTPDQLHVVTVSGTTGDIMHTILGQQTFFGNVNQQESNGSGLQFSVVDCAGVGDTLQLCGIASSNKGIYHTIRNANGSWQPSYGDVNSENSGSGYQFMDVSCAGDESSGDIQVCVVGTSGILLHTIRNAEGNWQGVYGDVNSENSGGSSHPAPFTNVDCAIINGTLYVCAIDTNRAIWFTYRTGGSNPSWQGSFTPLNNVLGPAIDISCASIGNTLYVCSVNFLTGLITHTSLPEGGSWQPADTAPPYDPHTSGARFFTLDCANVDNDLHVCATIAYGHILHIVRNDSGWQMPYDDVNQEEGSNDSYNVVSVGGVV